MTAENRRRLILTLLILIPLVAWTLSIISVDGVVVLYLAIIAFETMLANELE